MMTPSEVFRWPVEFVKRHWASILAIIAVIFFVSVFKNANFSKSDFDSIGGISMDQISAEQWIMLAIVLIVGIFLLYLLWRILGWWLFAIIILFVLLFQPARDRALDLFRRLEVSKAFTGTETVRSVLADKLDGFEVCGLEPEASYMFVEAKTGRRKNGDEASYTIRHKASSSTERANITGDFFSEPEKLPYPDKNYAGGLLVNGLPPGRTVTTNKRGCLKGSFNMEGGQYFDIDPISIGITFRKSRL